MFLGLLRGEIQAFYYILNCDSLQMDIQVLLFKEIKLKQIS